MNQSAKVETAKDPLLKGWQSDACVMRCGRLLSLSMSLRQELTLLRQSMSTAFCEVPPGSPVTLESLDTTRVVSY